MSRSRNLADLLESDGDVKSAHLDNTTSVTVTDNVTSTSTTEALSANQGKTLKDLVDGKQASDAQLTDVAGLAVTDGNFIVGNGSNFVAESAGTARTSLGLTIGTNVQAYDADISKTDVAETRTASINMADNVLQRPELKDYSETKVAMGANSIDLSAGNVHTKTISGATTLTFDNPPATGKTGSFTLVLVNGGTNVTFPTVLWDGGDAPSLSASGTDILSFMTMDGGTTWYGFISGLGMA